jgi:glycosyltransferase involved in cell wall biosynthesis
LEAWSKADLPKSAKLLVVGDGSEKEKLQILSDELDISDTVSFLGELKYEQVQELLSESDIFVLPSDSEGMSNALLEGMSHGLAVIAARIQANSSVIEEGVNGLMFHDSQELSKQISQLARSGNDRYRLALAARQTISKRYGFGQVASQYINLYSGVMNQAR